MIKAIPPMSSYERVRRFRERNPGYDRRYMARQRAAEKQAVARMKADAVAAAQVVAPAEPFMLPAPVADPMMAQLNELAALRGSQSPVELVPVVVVGDAERLRLAVRMQNAE
jgi:hypothetical protein